MGKPGVSVYNSFVKEFEKINKEMGLNQYIVPYLMSSHPGSRLKDAITLAEYIRDMGYIPDQVQDFYPTPGTVSTAMYYTGLNPLTMEEVYVPKNPHEKAMQRALIQYRRPENYDLVKEALLREHREDLIGFGPECLIRPRKPQEESPVGKRPERRNTSGKNPKVKGNDRHESHKSHPKASRGGNRQKSLR